MIPISQWRLIRWELFWFAWFLACALFTPRAAFNWNTGCWLICLFCGFLEWIVLGWRLSFLREYNETLKDLHDRKRDDDDQ